MKKSLILGCLLAGFLLLTMSCVSAIEFNTVADVNKSFLRRDTLNINNIKQKLEDSFFSKIKNQPSENWLNVIFEFIKYILTMAIIFGICIPLDILIIFLEKICIFDIIPDLLLIIYFFFNDIVNLLIPPVPI